MLLRSVVAWIGLLAYVCAFGLWFWAGLSDAMFARLTGITGVVMALVAFADSRAIVARKRTPTPPDRGD